MPRIWPYPRANGEHTIDVLRRLRAEFPDGKTALYKALNSSADAAKKVDPRSVPV